MEFLFDREKGYGATGYLPGGIGWYRKRFAKDHQADEVLYILFNGEYNNCAVWCNRQKLGENPSGYSPCWFDLMAHL